MSNYKVLPYKRGSQGAKTLADALGGVRLKEVGNPYRPRDRDLVINWGANTRPQRLQGVTMFNEPETIKKATDKLAFFQHMKEQAPESIPEFWTTASEIPDKAFPIVCRTILNGHSGAGIVIAKSRSELVSAPLYVKYIPKKNEYRIHVGRVEGRTNPDKIIAIQRKARSRSVSDADVNWEVRSHDNGFIFVRGGFVTPARVTDAARQALEVTGLDFGAIDVVDNEKKLKAYVLEINTAPGLEGQTVQDYKNYFELVGA